MSSSRLNGGFVAEHPVPPVPLFPSLIGNIDDPIMKKQPLVFVTSQRTPSYIAECLQSRLSRVQASSVGGATELAVGSGSDTAYFVTLTPVSAGSVIKVMRPANAPDDPPEPEMRFDIARCAT
jgi:hypothetical protein